MQVWDQVNEGSLQQGDFLPKTLIPQFGKNYGKANAGETEEVPLAPADVIIVTQSCDLVVRANGKSKARLVAVCPVYSMEDFTKANPHFGDSKQREKARRGEVNGLHLIPSITSPDDNLNALIAVFKEIYSLPFAYTAEHASIIGERMRLKSPYLEHFSQGFARFFMRVGLPSDIPPYVASE
jgi:hypothetical protein